MKRKVLLVAAIVTGSFAFAQEGSSFKDQNGQEVLPQAGDIGISFGTGAFPSFGGGNTIMVKKFKDANNAMRASLSFGVGSSTTNPVNGSDATKNDEVKVSTTGFSIGAGMEKRKGSGRVQAVYGAEASFGLNSTSTETTYDAASAPLKSQTVNAASVLTFGVKGFLGAEYFFAPKFSIGAEYGLGLGITSTGDAETTTVAATSTTNTTKGGSSLNFGTSSTTASINFYF